jgi:hypothetical protein
MDTENVDAVRKEVRDHYPWVEPAGKPQSSSET